MFEQLVAPADEYLPPPHAVLFEPPVQYEPAGQVVHDVLPVVVLYVPAAHVVHALDELEPVLAFFVPAEHAVRPPVLL